MWPRVCRVCLASGVRMYSMEPHRASFLYVCYTQLTGVSSLNGLHYVCYECARLLIRAHQLKQKSLRAHTLLQAILNDAGQVSQSNILSIDRAEHSLVSPLKRGPITTTVYDIEHSDDGEHKTETNGSFLQDDSKIWLQDIEVKDEPRDWSREASPDHQAPLRSPSSRPDRKHKKRKKYKIKKLDGDEKQVKIKDAAVTMRRKTKKELAEYYSRFVSVSHMSPEEARREMEQRREASGFKSAAHKCLLCYRGFWRAAAYANHMVKHDPSSGPLECDYCHLRFDNRHSLLDHFRHFHNLKFACNKCAYTCTNRNLARQHEAWHNGTLYSCKYCNANFSHYSTRQNHLRLQHSVEAACRLCGRCFVGRRGVRAHTLRAHAARSHQEGEDVRCDVCAVTFASREAYNRHLLVSARHNLSETTTACAVCGEAFPNASELQRHRRTHHARRISQDGERAKQARQKADGGGERKEGGKRRRLRPDMVCETCGRVFHTNWDFDTHRRKHTGEKPFNCKYCSKAFALKGVLKVHLRTHTQEKPHACAVCGKAFAERSNMLRHMQIHSEAKPVACDVCEKEFKNASSLKVHVKYVHLKRPYPVRRQRKRQEPPHLPPVPAAMSTAVREQLAWRV